MCMLFFVLFSWPQNELALSESLCLGVVLSESYGSDSLLECSGLRTLSSSCREEARNEGS